MADQVAAEMYEKLKRATSLLQALKISGVNLRRDAEGLARTNCPFPVHSLRSPTFIIKLSEAESFRCEGCGVSGGVREYVEALCAPVPVNLPGNSFIARAVESRASSARLARVRSGDAANDQVATDEQAGEVYEALLWELELFDHHIEYLLRHGLSTENCFENLYRSLPVSRARRLEVCERLLAEGCCLEGVPGFFRIPETAVDPNLRGRWCVGGDELGRRAFKGGVNGQGVRHEVGGILVPVRDAHSRIIRLEILNDLPGFDVPETLKALWPPRLSLFVSPRQRDKEMTGIARLHRANPSGGADESGGTVWLTDSALRADILAAQFSTPVLGVTDFAQLWGETIEAISAYKRVTIAIGREEILYLAKLSREAARRGIDARIANWEQRETIDEHGLWLPDYHWNPQTYEQWWSEQFSESQEQGEAPL